jgi:hypothetical protein
MAPDVGPLQPEAAPLAAPPAQPFGLLLPAAQMLVEAPAMAAAPARAAPMEDGAAAWQAQAEAQYVAALLRRELTPAELAATPDALQEAILQLLGEAVEVA